MVNNKKIGEYIRKRRKDKNLSQKELADLLHISFQAVSKWEVGETLPDVSLLLDLADVLDTTSDKILSGGQIILRSNRSIDIQNIMEGFKALENLRFYFGEESTFYLGAIEGINQKMNIDFEQYIKNENYKETMIAEAIIQYLMLGYQVNVDDLKEHIKSEKVRNIIYRYIGDDNTMNLLKYEENPALFEQIRKLNPYFKNLKVLNELPGEYIRMKPSRTYWCTQIETDEDYCYGIAVDEEKIYVFTYGANGVNQTLVHEEDII